MSRQFDHLEISHCPEHGDHAGPRCPNCPKPRQEGRQQAFRAAEEKARHSARTPPKAPGTGRKRHSREADLQRDCEQYLRLHGIEYLHLSYRAREHRGWPDLTFCAGGAPCAVELKNATGQLSGVQMEVLGRLAGNGWRVAVIRDSAGFARWVAANAGGGGYPVNPAGRWMDDLDGSELASSEF